MASTPRPVFIDGELPNPDKAILELLEDGLKVEEIYVFVPGTIEDLRDDVDVWIGRLESHVGELLATAQKSYRVGPYHSDVELARYNFGTFDDVGKNVVFKRVKVGVEYNPKIIYLGG